MRYAEQESRLRGQAGAQRQPGRLSRASKQLLYALAIFGAASLLISWYLQRSLPLERQQQADDATLFAEPSPDFCSRRRPTKVVAHGGDTTRAPPNTARAFQAAIDQGAHCIEVDVALTKDMQLVVMHVRELGQLLGRSGMQVGDMRAQEVLALRWPSGDPVMAAADALRMTSPSVDCIIIDVKTYNDKRGQPVDEMSISEALVRLVHQTRCTNCLIWAKSDSVVRRIRQLSPGQRTGYVVMNDTADSLALGMAKPLRLDGPEVVALQHRMAEASMRTLLHGAGKEIYAFTINGAADLKRVLDVGIDAIVTNYPSTALDAIDYRLSRCGSAADL